MYRNLDLVTLRTLVAVADTGGMTRAGNLLHLTQSTVSMQIKRLEEQVSRKILLRDGRTVTPTVEGEELILYARKMIELNDDAMRMLTKPRYDVSISFGVPIDIVHPFIPVVLNRFAQRHPKQKINLSSGMTFGLRRGLEEGLYDIILTTELTPSDGGITLLRQPLVWSGAYQGQCWKSRPLPVALSHRCMFRKPVVDALEHAEIDWIDVINTVEDDSAIMSAAADLGVRAELACSNINGLEHIDHQGLLPDLPEYCVVLYYSNGLNKEIAREFGEVIGQVFSEQL